MKAIQSSVFRALCAIVVGVLLIEYREDTVRWITILTGVMFFLSGVISIVSYYAGRKQADGIQVYDADGRLLSGYRQSFPIVGLGSVILGAVLAMMPTTFITGIVYIFAAILILGAINQMMVLARVNRIASVGLFYWVAPSVILLVGVVAMAWPEAIASAPLLVIGWCMLVYGVTECVNALKTHAERRRWERQKQAASAQVGQESSLSDESSDQTEGNSSEKEGSSAE